MNAVGHVATILLVDDEAHITAALQRAFRREPYDFLTATSAAAAFELLERVAVQVVISDEQMPGMSGSEFLAGVRKKYPDTVRMILSGQASLESAVRAINEGEVYRYFLKPCNPSDLINTVRQALAHKRLADQSRRLLREYQKQSSKIARIERNGAGLLLLDTDEEGAVMVDESDADCDVNDLLMQIDLAISGPP